MIPDIFHHYKTKEEKDLICFLRDAEYWNNKKNALLQVLGIPYYSMLQKPKPITKNLTFCTETEQLIKNIEEKLKNVRECAKGNCEL